MWVRISTTRVCDVVSVCFISTQQDLVGVTEGRPSVRPPCWFSFRFVEPAAATLGPTRSLFDQDNRQGFGSRLEDKESRKREVSGVCSLPAAQTDFTHMGQSLFSFLRNFSMGRRSLSGTMWVHSFRKSGRLLSFCSRACPCTLQRGATSLTYQ